MNMEQFTNKVKEQISTAQIKALQMQHQQLLPLHMLSVLLEEKDIVMPLLQQTGTNLSKLQNDIDKQLEKIPAVIPRCHRTLRNNICFMMRSFLGGNGFAPLSAVRLGAFFESAPLSEKGLLPPNPHPPKLLFCFHHKFCPN